MWTKMRGVGRGKLSAVIFAMVFAVWFGAAAQSARAQDSIAVGMQVAGGHLPALGENPLGYGFRFTYAFYQPFIAFDTEINTFPTHASGNFGQTQAFFGLKAGARVGRYGVFFKVRPGFDQFGGGADPGRLTRRLNFAMDIGGGVEYYFAPHLALRLDLGDVMTHFGGGVLLAPPGGPVGPSLGTRNSFQTTLGFLVHF